MGIGRHSLKTWIYDSDYTADDLSSTGDGGQILDVVEPITVVEVGCLVTTVLNGAATVAFDRRVTTGSDTGRVDGLNSDGDAVVTIPDTTAAGKYVYKQVRVDLDIGDQVVPEVTSGATSGACRYVVKYLPRDETIDNQTDAVESA